MASETDINDDELPDDADLGEGPETFDDAPEGEGVEDEDNEAGNDLVDDAELAGRQILEEDDEGLEETGSPTPEQVEDEDDVIDPEGDIGNFASHYSGVEV